MVSNPLISNTDSVKQTDRTAQGPQPDNTPVGGGATGGLVPGFVAMAGDVTGPSNANVVSNISQLGYFTRAQVGYPAGGAFGLRFDLGSWASLGLVANLSLSPAGSAGMVNGRQQVLDLTNAAGVPLTMTYNASWKRLTGTLPAALAAGASMRLTFECDGTTEADISVSHTFPPSTFTGTVTSVATAGRFISAAPNPIVGAGTITGVDSNVINVLDYGAIGDGSTDDFLAIQNGAIAAGISSGRSFALYFPSSRPGSACVGIYKCSGQLTITLPSNRYAVSIYGDGRGVSQIFFTAATATCGIVISRGASGGTYLTDTPFSMSDMSLVTSGSAANSIALVLKMTPGLTDAGTQGSYIRNVGFFTLTNGANAWDYNIALSNWSQVWIQGCYCGALTSPIYIEGSNAATSIFWITECHFQGFTYGVQAFGKARAAGAAPIFAAAAVTGPNARLEGVFCRGNSFIVGNYAVWAENDNTGGALEVTGGQINCLLGPGAGVHVKGFAGITIQSISSLNNGNGGGAGFWNAVEIMGGGCWGAIVANNKIDLVPGGNGIGVYIVDTGAAPRGTVHSVTGNSFNGFSAFKNVQFDTGISRSICANNVSDGGAYTDTPAVNTFVNNV